MKSSIRITGLILLTSAVLSAQKKYEKAVYKPESVETPEMTVSSKDINATKEMLKFQLKIANRTDQILLYKPEESAFVIGGTEKKPKEKNLIIYPTESEKRVINLGSTGLQPSDFVYRVAGVYRVSETDRTVQAPDFALPASTNDFKAENFSCSLSSLNKESDKTTAKFECRYTGDKIGVINPGRAAVKLPDGTEIANAKSNAKSDLLMKGESTKITLTWNRMEGGRATDMQKIKMMIIWRNTFVESELMPIPMVELHMTLDPAESK